MFQMTSAQWRARESMLQRGHEALLRELGEEDTVEFLRLASNADRPEKARSGLRDTVVNISADKATTEVVLRFSRETTWMRFSVEDALQFAHELARRAHVLLKDQL